MSFENYSNRAKSEHRCDNPDTELCCQCKQVENDLDRPHEWDVCGGCNGTICFHCVQSCETLHCHVCKKLAMSSALCCCACATPCGVASKAASNDTAIIVHEQCTAEFYETVCTAATQQCATTKKELNHAKKNLMAAQTRVDSLTEQVKKNERDILTAKTKWQEEEKKRASKRRKKFAMKVLK